MQRIASFNDIGIEPIVPFLRAPGIESLVSNVISSSTPIYKIARIGKGETGLISVNLISHEILVGTRLRNRHILVSAKRITCVPFPLLVISMTVVSKGSDTASSFGDGWIHQFAFFLIPILRFMSTIDIVVVLFKANAVILQERITQGPVKSIDS